MDTRNVDIVLVRMDKIGDLVVSLPVDEHPVFKGQHVHWFISKGLGFIARQAAPKREATEFLPGFSVREFIRMVRWLRTSRPRLIILLHNPWWVSCAAWLARVPQRMGRRSQWHGFLWVNLPVRQKRSRSDRHESDFNFDFVEYGFNRLGVRPAQNLELLKKSYLRLRPPNPFATLAALGLTANGYRVVHPGMGGSALNWPTDFFAELIETLATDSTVVITGTKTDRKYLEPLKHLAVHPKVRWLAEELQIAELLDLLAQARSVVGPSTGVLHLAAALGTPTVGIYSPLKGQHPLRWAAKGLHVKILVPKRRDHDHFPPEVLIEVMREISVAQVCAAVQEVEAGHARINAHTQPGV